MIPQFIKELWYSYRDYTFGREILSMAKPEVDVIMDIGCGNRPQHYIKARKKYIMVDPAKPEIPLHTPPPEYISIEATWQDVIRYNDFKLNTVILMDVIEHLSRNEAGKLLTATEQITDQIVVFTPYGFMEQEDGPWNTHWSGWHPKDFGSGWKVKVLQGFNAVDFQGKKLEKPNDAILAVFTRDES